ncbi:MAG: L-seryl-tRNA(Sec) selenium transferase [bacterium]
MSNTHDDEQFQAENELRKIPGVDELIQRRANESDLPIPLLTMLIRRELERLRERIKQGDTCPESEEIARSVRQSEEELISNRIQPVINATGVILHTNLGRAPYPPKSLNDSRNNLQGYSSLEMNLSRGGRGGRGRFAEILMTQLTGVEEAAIVNNCSSALVLALQALSDDREVVISRGELVQIGGGFRIPEILEVSGARLREVGTTNRTSLEDYKRAISSDTGLVLTVHRSNFDIEGFTDSPDISELAELAEASDLPLVSDLGSGALVDTEQYSIPHEPRPGEILDKGADIVMFSGDKLLGGPQCGILLGREDLVKEMKNHPLFRALRCGKATLTSLESTLELYARGNMDDIPVHSLLGLDEDILETRARDVVERIDHPDVKARRMIGTVGGGALPDAELPGWGIVIQLEDPETVQEFLRQGNPPVIASIKQDNVQVHMRTVFPEQEESLKQRIEEVLNEPS